MYVPSSDREVTVGDKEAALKALQDEIAEKSLALNTSQVAA